MRLPSWMCPNTCSLGWTLLWTVFNSSIQPTRCIFLGTQSKKPTKNSIMTNMKFTRQRKRYRICRKYMMLELTVWLIYAFRVTSWTNARLTKLGKRFIINVKTVVLIPLSVSYSESCFSHFNEEIMGFCYFYKVIIRQHLVILNVRGAKLGTQRESLDSLNFN